MKKQCAAPIWIQDGFMISLSKLKVVRNLPQNRLEEAPLVERHKSERNGVAERGAERKCMLSLKSTCSLCLSLCRDLHSNNSGQ